LPPPLAGEGSGEGARPQALSLLPAQCLPPGPSLALPRKRGGDRPCPWRRSGTSETAESERPRSKMEEPGGSMIAVRYLAAAVQGFAAVLLLVAVAINAANILGRYCAVECEAALERLHLDPLAYVVPLHPIEWADEIMLFLLVGMVFLG